MAVTYDATVKTARMQAVKDQVGASGKLKIGTAGMATILAVIDLGAGGSVAAGVWTLIASALSDISADNTGTAAAAIITTSADASKVSGLTVGLTGSGADIILDNTNIQAGQTVTINSAAITHAA